ncbi:MAG: glycosyltransferase [Treponema sp.]|nr:glycosyltransferase [Treponema sp.]
MTEGISVVIPSYQEGENLKNILPRLNGELSGIGVPYEILCVDTMEPLDDTEAVCRGSGATYVKRAGGNNYGDAIRTGFRTAQYKYTVVMDGDGSHDPKCIKEFYEEIQKGHDLIIGSRYTKGGDTENPFILKAMSYVLNVTYRLMFGIQVKDVSDSYRMYRTEQTQALTLECDNFDIVEEILIKLSMSRKGYDIKEIPIYFEERKAGVSKRKLGRFILSYIATMRRLKAIQIKYRRSSPKGSC